MKIRTSFVSNSSTSSFVILGILLNRDERSGVEILSEYVPLTLNEIALKKYKKSWKECDEYEQCNLEQNKDMPLRVLTHEEQGAPKGKTVVGIEIASFDDDGIMNDDSVKLSDVLKQLASCGIRHGDVDIISGTRMS